MVTLTRMAHNKKVEKVDWDALWDEALGGKEDCSRKKPGETVELCLPSTMGPCSPSIPSFSVRSDSGNPRKLFPIFDTPVRVAATVTPVVVTTKPRKRKADNEGLPVMLKRPKLSLVKKDGSVKTSLKQLHLVGYQLRT